MAFVHHISGLSAYSTVGLARAERCVPRSPANSSFTRGTVQLRKPKYPRATVTCVVQSGGPQETTPQVPSQVQESTTIAEAYALDEASGNAEILAPDARIPLVLLFLGGLCVYQDNAWMVLGFPLLGLSLLTFYQLTKVRFVFGPTKLNLAYRKGGSLQFVRGWSYDQMKTWSIFPSKSFPVCGFIKEEESYAGRGSVHYFPMLFNSAQFIRGMEARVSSRQEK